MEEARNYHLTPVKWLSHEEPENSQRSSCNDHNSKNEGFWSDKEETSSHLNTLMINDDNSGAIRANTIDNDNERPEARQSTTCHHHQQQQLHHKMTAAETTTMSRCKSDLRSLISDKTTTKKIKSSPQVSSNMTSHIYKGQKRNNNNNFFLIILLAFLSISSINDKNNIFKSSISVINCQTTTASSTHFKQQQGCPYPPVNTNCQVNIIAQAPAVPLLNTEFVADEYATLKQDTQASYKCDQGFELIGQESSTCLPSGKWSSQPPNCVTNIALGKPTNQSSTVKGGDSRNANDGKLVTQHEQKYCTETRVDQSPWWQIDLLQTYEIRSVRILGRACCNAQLSLHDLEIRIGNSSTLQGNRLCAWHPEQLDEGVARDFQCAHPIIGRFVSIQMVGIEAALSICEVMVFSTKEFPADRCNVQQSTLAPTNNKQQVTTVTSVTTTSSSILGTNNNIQGNNQQDPLLVFNRTCYEMQTTNGGSFLVADTYCKARGGALLHSVTNLTQSFISQELERMKTKFKSKLVWLGAKRDGSSPIAPGAILPGSTSALIDNDDLNPQSTVFSISRNTRSLRDDDIVSLDESSSDNLFSVHGGITLNEESSPIFNPTSRTNLYQVTGAGAGGLTSRGSQTFGLQISSTPHSNINRTNSDSSHQRSLIISQPSQLASFFNQPVVTSSSSSPSITNSIVSSTSSTSSTSSNSHPVNFPAPGSHVHRTLRPPSLVSTNSNNNNNINNNNNNNLHALPTSTQVNWATGSSNHVQNWRWVGDQQSESIQSPVTSFLWAEDQPNNYNNQQDCIVMDSGKKWLWNDVTCELDYLPWVCQYRPSGCGSPDRHENSTIIELSSVTNSVDLDSVFQLGRTITYACPIGHRLDGSRQRKCQYDGTWSGKAPKCQYVDCGQLPAGQTIENGRIIYLNQSQTTVGSQIKYVCYEDYVLVGNDMRYCGLDGKWTGKQPFCAYKWCPMLQQIPNGFLNVSSYSENSIASYQCNSGYKLIGNDTRQCLLGGKWTNQEPFCQFVDCGQPKQISNGQYQLVNKTTNYLSQATYSCNENYTLGANSNNRIICSHTNRWTGKEPQCSLIDCGIPQANPGSSFMGSQFSVHSTIEYKCDPGFKEVGGSPTRTCARDGQWSGLPLSCKYVDCGRVPAILKGEVSYTNGTTYLASQVSYECTPGNRLSGHRVRFCGPDGRWTGSSPKCEEVRCDAPELPANGSAVYIGNDRSFKEQSFSVGVTVQYECDYGHVVKGSWASRLCQANGEWSGEAPICQFVDCGTPISIENGQYVLKMRSQANPPAISSSPSGSTSSSSLASSISSFFESTRRSDSSLSSSQQQQSISSGPPTTLTYFGTVAHYSCDINYKLMGPSQRECLETGLWRQPMPTCEPIQCPKPDFFDEFTQVSLVPRQQPGASSSDRIRLIANKQWIRDQEQIGASFGVGDKLHYSCLPGYELYGGPEFRLCTQYGQWSGSSTPRCRLIDCGRPAPIGSEGRSYLLNQTTSFNSVVEYSCVRPFKLIEVKIRQAGNLIETLQQAQAGVTQILTALPIGVKVCANNGQWMPNDQQPKCVSSTSATGQAYNQNTPEDSANDNNSNSGGSRGGAPFDGADNTLDGSNRNSNHHDHHLLSTSNVNSGIVDPAIAGDPNQLSDHQSNGGSAGNQATSSLWAMVVIILCLMIMFGLILLTLICIRSGKKSTKQATNGPNAPHHLRGGAILAGSTSAGAMGTTTSANGMQIHQLAASNGQHPLLNGAAAHAKGALAAIGLVSSGKHQQQIGLVTNNTNQQQQHNIYSNNGAAKMFPGGVMMTPQAAANLQQAQLQHLHQQQQHQIVANGLHHHHQHGMLAYSNCSVASISQAETIMINQAASANNNQLGNNQSRSIAADNAAHNLIAMQQNHPKGMLKASDQQNGANVAGSINMMDAYSRTLSIIDNGHATAKTIRHNPNGLVTFVSPAQQQHQQLQLQQQQHNSGVTKIPTSVGGSSSNSTSSGSHNTNHSSPQSISTSLSVSPSSSSSPLSSAHHTIATRLSATNSPSSSTASSTKSNSTADLKTTTAISTPNVVNLTNSSSTSSASTASTGEYQSPLGILNYQGQLVTQAGNTQHQNSQQPPQLSPPSLPAHPPPSHRLQQHQKQMVKISANQHQVKQQQQQNNNNNKSSVDIVAGSNSIGLRNNQEQQQQHHYMEPSI